MTKREIHIGDQVVVAAKDHPLCGDSVIVLDARDDMLTVAVYDRTAMGSTRTVEIHTDKVIRPSGELLL